MYDKELEWQEGLIDSSNLMSNTDELIAVKKVIDQHVKKQSLAEKLRLQIYKVYLEMEDYIQQSDISGASELRSVGYFLQKMLGIYQVSSKQFAEYFNLKDISNIIAQKQKIDVVLAQQLAKIFDMQSEIWIKVEFKNELWRVKNEEFTLSKENFSITDISPALAA